MAQITIVAVFVVAAVICFVFAWSSKTHRMIDSAIINAYFDRNENFDWDEFSSRNEPLIVTDISRYCKNIRNLSDVAEDEIILDSPRKSNHLFAQATDGEWGKLYKSHYGKGATLHTYRVKNFTKKILHPCMAGGKPECFS